jgi:hypothetical protein
MTKAYFDQQTFAGALPTVFVVQPDFPPTPTGAATPGFDVGAGIRDDRFLMKLLHFITPKRVHGLLHYDGVNQLFFMGYECQRCNRIFLVPDNVAGQDELPQALRHSCMEAPAS